MLNEHIKNWLSLIDTMTNPVSILDTGFNIVHANKAFIDLCAGRGDVKGMKCNQLIRDKDWSAENCLLTKILNSGKPQTSEIYEPSLKKFLVATASPIYSESNLIGILYSLTDITEQKMSEETYREVLDIYAEAAAKMILPEASLRGI